VPLGERSILKPVSFVLLSVQVRLIWVDEAAAALRSLGAQGMTVALAVLL
jgi:hypothetical protein